MGPSSRIAAAIDHHGPTTSQNPLKLELAQMGLQRDLGQTEDSGRDLSEPRINVFVV